MKLRMIFSALIGVGIGVAGTYVYLNEKYNKRAQDEVAEARKHYEEAIKEFTVDISKGDVEETDKLAKEYYEADAVAVKEAYEHILEENYISNDAEPVEEQPKPKRKGGRKKKKVESDGLIISSDEFVELNGYDKKTLYYFSEDKVFCDTEYEVVEEGMTLIGEDNLDAVGLYEDGVLYVRSDAYGTDYEVILKDESYRDFMGE